MEPSIRPRSSHRQDKSIAGLYDMERSLGSGHFAVVKLARHVFSGEKVAIKVIDKSKLDDVAKAHLYQEVRCMKLVQHPNVVRLYQVIDTQSKLYLILEYGDGGDMYDHIMKYEGQGISEDKARHYFKQIVSAIDYCHKLHVVHRDLKPENVIFFKNNDLAKLTDFGFSNSFLPGEKLYTSCGSLAYSAPEILLGDSYDAPAVDVWSLGVILYMMVCGRGPFNHASDSETLTKIMDCKYDLPNDLSDECKSLIKRMLVRKASERASIDSIIRDKWVNRGASIALSHTPLISEISISRDVHHAVIHKMSESWSKDDIEKSLKENQYDHATATYFLLAERIVKKRRGSAVPFHVKLDERHSVPTEFMLNSDSDISTSLEQNDSEMIDLSVAVKTIASENKMHSDHRDRPITSNLNKEYSHSDECIAENASGHATEFSPNNIASRPSRLTYPFAKQKTKSSPNLLNEPITEENESEFEDSPRNSPHLQRRASQRRRQFHSCRLSSPIHSRRSSYSSSDDDDNHILLEKTRLLSYPPISSVTNSQSGQSTNVNQVGNTNTTNTTNNTYHDLNEKMLSLIIDDLEQNILSSKVFHPSVNLKLNNMMNSAYGRHLSDTNLTTYSMQLQLALAREKLKSISSISPIHQYRSKKCSSDTNLVKRFGKKKQHLILSSEFFKTKEMIFKYLKRGVRSNNKSSSSLSLSAPIAEEDTSVTGGDTAPQLSKSPKPNENRSDTFSNIQGVDHQENTHQPPSKCDSRSSVKYYPLSSTQAVVQNVENNAITLQTEAKTATNIGEICHLQQGKQMFAPAVATGSVCCSLF